MIGFLYRLRLPLAFAGLLALALFLLLRAPAGRGEGEMGRLRGILLEATAPVERVLTLPLEYGRAFWTNYIDLIAVRREGERLRTRVSELERENIELRELLTEGGHLARMEALRGDFEAPQRSARVVGEDLSPWLRSLLLDRGRNDGVRSGMPVLGEEGLVGLVTATSPGAARVMILSSRRSSVDAMVQRSRARGIVRGDGEGGLVFTFMSRGDDVREGDMLITSGISGVYQKGLRIGVVRSVHTPDLELLHSAQIESAVNFSRLEQVSVMLVRSPTLELLFGSTADGDAHPGAEAP